MIHRIASAHDTIMQEPCVKQLSAAVRGALDQAQDPPATTTLVQSSFQEVTT